MDDKIRTTSYRGQEAYDRMLADCDISSLRFLSSKYDKDLDRYKNNHDLENKEEFREYRDIQQRKKMIDEELTVRLMNKSATLAESNTFDSTIGVNYHNEGNNIESTEQIVFSADETAYSYDREGEDYVEGIEDIEEFDRLCNENKEKSRKEKYDGWKY